MSTIPFYKNIGFWGFILLITSYIPGYLGGGPGLPQGASTLSFTSTTFLALVGILLALIGFWKHPQHRGWSVVTIIIAIIIWLLSFIGLNILF